MAHISTEVNTLRDHFTRLSDDFMMLAVLLQRAETLLRYPLLHLSNMLP